MIGREKTSLYTTFNVLLSFNPPLESGVMGILLRLEYLLEVFGLRDGYKAAAAISNLGLFKAEMSSDAFQLLGMSEIGMLPAFFAQRSKYGTPTISILCSATGVIFLSWIMLSRDHRVSEFLVRVRNASVNLLP